MLFVGQACDLTCIVRQAEDRPCIGLSCLMQCFSQTSRFQLRLNPTVSFLTFAFSNPLTIQPSNPPAFLLPTFQPSNPPTSAFRPQPKPSPSTVYNLQYFSVIELQHPSYNYSFHNAFYLPAVKRRIFPLGMEFFNINDIFFSGVYYCYVSV